MSLRGFDTINFWADDVETATAWYQEFLGSTPTSSGRGPVGSIEELDVALCHGWIDGQRKSQNGVSFLQRYSRRARKGSLGAAGSRRSVGPGPA